MAILRSIIRPSDDFQIEYRTVTPQEALDQKLTLVDTPRVESKTRLTFTNGTDQVYGVDYEVQTDELVWGGFAAETIIEAGDVLKIEYFL